MSYRKCSKCDIEKSHNEFNKHKTGRDGIRPDCKDCVKEYKKTYRLQNSKKLSRESKEYRGNNAEKLKYVGRKYYVENIDKIKVKAKIYRNENK